MPNLIYSTFPILSLAIWVPVAFGILILLVGRDERAGMIRWLSLAGSLVSLLVTLPLAVQFDREAHGLQFVERHPWITLFNVNYDLGIDGISLWLIIMTALMLVIVVIASWQVIQTQVAQYMGAFLILSGLMIGVFATFDGLLFYVFFEATLIPMFIIIGLWGGERRIYAAFKFFLYTFLGSLPMLLALIYLYLQTHSFNLYDWYALKMPLTPQIWVFLAFLSAFAVKIPMWPVHTWLPDAHVEAPTGGSVILAAIMLKLGAYGFTRFSLPVVPDACRHLVSAAMFLCVGVIYDRMHTRQIADYGGVVHVMPRFAAFFVLFAFANIGLPGTSGFVGEVLVIMGAVKVNVWIACAAGLSLVLGASYTLWMIKRVLYGPVGNEQVAALQDIGARETLFLAVLAVCVIAIGVYPAIITDAMQVSVADLMALVGQSKL